MKMLEEFWSFMKERELIRLRRRAGLPRDKWTDDAIFKEYSFTNVKREHDRYSQFAKRWYHRWFGGHDIDHKEDEQNNAELLINCAIVRYFGTQHSVEALGFYSWASTDAPNGNWDEYLDRLRHLGMCGDLTFTGSYIVPNAGRSDEKYLVVADILDGIEKRSYDVIRAWYSSGWRMAAEVLTDCYGVGSFMAKEVLLDYQMATGSIPEDWSTWTPVGPGGCRGASWVRDGYRDKIPESEALDVIRKIYATRDDKIYIDDPTPRIVPRPPWRLRWPEHLFIENGNQIGAVKNVSLDLTDIQFQLCEFDKYNRAKHGLGRPKRRFRPTIDKVTCEV